MRERTRMRLGWTLIVLIVAASGCLASDAPAPASSSEATDAWEDTLPAAILWAHPYPDLLVEIDHVEGREPSRLALETLRRTLEEVSDKERVILAPPTMLPREDGRFHGRHEWTLEELADVHARYFDAGVPGAYGADGTARLHLLYLNGVYRLDAGGGGLVAQHAAGLQLEDALLMFPDDLPVGFGQGADRPWSPYYERKLLVHEAGHAMGLVNAGIPMQRPHVDRDGVHSDNPGSVMAVGNHGPFALEMVQDNQWAPYRFDADDLADLDAFRERGRARFA